MPHKRAKKSLRDANKLSAGHDLAPSSSALKGQEGLSKTASRILNAEAVQRSYNEKKRKRAGDTASAAVAGNGERSSKRPKLDPNESLKSFYTRVESTYRTSTREEIKKVSNRGKKERRAVKAEIKKKEEEEERKRQEARENTTWRRSDKRLPGKVFVRNDVPDSRTGPGEDEKTNGEEKDAKFRDKEKEFKKPERIRLHDVVSAPPKLPRLKGADSLASETVGFKLPIHMAEEELEEERERVVRRYRELKESRAKKEEMQA
ncbi:hypothetical protein BT69DRAFT_1329768 [Atractiella rhizophila]|nr:hypothetical protein BT69DRAFT_1329768 [Atractiella rhizophila]